MGPYPIADEGEAIYTVTDHFSPEEYVVGASSDGLLVGVLENLAALPGHPPCHLVRVDSEIHDEIRAEIDTGEFDGYRANGPVW